MELSENDSRARENFCPGHNASISENHPFSTPLGDFLFVVDLVFPSLLLPIALRMRRTTERSMDAGVGGSVRPLCNDALKGRGVSPDDLVRWFRFRLGTHSARRFPPTHG